LQNLVENNTWARDAYSRDPDAVIFLSRQDRDETFVCLKTVSRPRPHPCYHDTLAIRPHSLSYTLTMFELNLVKPLNTVHSSRLQTHCFQSLEFLLTNSKN